MAKSLREACAELKTSLGDDVELWQWGKIHSLMLNHALGRIKLLRPLLNIGPFPSPGDGTTINTGFYRHSNPYAHTVGASLRFVIDVGELATVRLYTCVRTIRPPLFTPLRRSDVALACRSLR